MAMRDSVTVSIAAERMGISSVMLLVRRALVETWVGRTPLRAGMRRTSSNVRPSLVKRSPTRLTWDGVYRDGSVGRRDRQPRVAPLLAAGYARRFSRHAGRSG